MKVLQWTVEEEAYRSVTLVEVLIHLCTIFLKSLLMLIVFITSPCKNTTSTFLFLYKIKSKCLALM